MVKGTVLLSLVALIPILPLSHTGRDHTCSGSAMGKRSMAGRGGIRGDAVGVATHTPAQSDTPMSHATLMTHYPGFHLCLGT